MRTGKQYILKKEIQFNKILSEHEERIRRICRYYNSNHEEQKDMYQEVLVNIWKSLDSFRGDSSMGTWIYRVAVNTSLSYTGKAFREMKLMITRNTQNLNHVIDDNSPDEKLIEESKFDQLQNELNQLSVIDKALISLMLEGLSMKEISEVIGITEPNVKVKIHRIKEHLRNKLNEGNYETK